MKRRYGQKRIYALPSIYSDIIKYGIMISMIVSICIVLPAAGASVDITKVSYVYNLSNFNGPVLSQGANIYVDKERKDVYVYDRHKRDIRIFDESGMEVYIFGDDGSFGSISDLTVDGNGNIIVISRMGPEPEILLCNYRGEKISSIDLKNLPPEFAGFRPERVIHNGGKLYMLDSGAVKIIVTGLEGAFEKGYDIALLLDIDDRKRDQNEITGFSIDEEGNMLFNISVLFSAYRLSPDGKIESFGKSGGGPGTFGVIAGITTDEKGYIYISDKLRCVVLVFNSNLEFQTEFGYRGNRPGNLIVPNDIEADGKGRIYVAQAGERGVSVFSVSHE